MHVLIAPDKLRGTYSAAEAAAALELGWRSARPDDTTALMPLADGGEGTAEALCVAAGGRWLDARVHDALGRECDARCALLDDLTAAVDVSEAIGSWRVTDLPRDPLGASSAGAGELIRAAIDAGAATVIVGVGGTATTDGGAGLRDALGPVPDGVKLIAAVDVSNPLLGPRGAAAVFGPQKGASSAQVAELERRLAALDLPTADLPGAGAGGGIGGMLLALGAEAISGAELVMDRVGFAQGLARADVCVTAEGHVDMQTLDGKVVVRVAERCREAGVQCFAVGGRVDRDAAAALADRGCEAVESSDLVAGGHMLTTRYP